jgi:hypothetical protein
MTAGVYQEGDVVSVKYKGTRHTGKIKAFTNMRVKGRCIPVATVELSLTDLGGKVHTIEVHIPHTELGKA